MNGRRAEGRKTCVLNCCWKIEPRPCSRAVNPITCCIRPGRRPAATSRGIDCKTGPVVRGLADIGKGEVDLVVVYKVDRLTRSLTDFARIIETFDARGVSFVSVTQQFNTANSMGRLTLHVLLSFAQFEREVTAGPGPAS